MVDNRLKNQHISWRAGFGPSISEYASLHKQKPASFFKSILKSSEKKPDFFDVTDPEISSLVNRSKDNGTMMSRLNPEEKQMLRKKSVQDIAKLNLRWLEEMRTSPAQLREKMSLFWHGHFATKTVNIIFDQALLNVIREHALGNFRDLLFGVSKSASMIQFLNNNQNRKGHPNENFARELMELFTLGRGHYTENDIKESARAFTGWGANIQGEFEFRPRLHDSGAKVFLEKTGNFSGEDILDILLSQQQTAVFITRKIYQFFVNEIVVEERISFLASIFFQSGYDIQVLLTHIFSSDWFFDANNIGTQIKSPILWLTGMRRQLPMDFTNPSVQIIIERLLGQVLFSPPNVAGWPGGKHWIDSSTLMLRMQIPKLISQPDELNYRPKDDDDTMMGMRDQTNLQNIRKLKTKGPQMFQAIVDWPDFIKNFDQLSDNELFPAIRQFLCQRPTPITEEGIIKYIDQTNRDKRIQSVTIRLMDTPEYQLC